MRASSSMAGPPFRQSNMIPLASRIPLSVAHIRANCHSLVLELPDSKNVAVVVRTRVVREKRIRPGLTRSGPSFARRSLTTVRAHKHRAPRGSARNLPRISRRRVGSDAVPVAHVWGAPVGLVRWNCVPSSGRQCNVSLAFGCETLSTVNTPGFLCPSRLRERSRTQCKSRQSWNRHATNT